MPVFILVPSFDPTGPVKGACALANMLAQRFAVTLVALKDLSSSQPIPALSDGVARYSLASSGGWRKKHSAYQAMLRQAQASSGFKPVSISMCFSADIMNALCATDAHTVSSVRSNLFRDYRMGYGLPGLPLALFHFLLLNRFSHVIAMTRSMADQIRRFVSRDPIVIGNFVDEHFLQPYRTVAPEGPARFLFLGSLTVRKQPLLLVEAFADLVSRGVDARLDIVGKGVLEAEIKARIKQLGLQSHICLHGHLSDPYSLLAVADVMVLPSLSEGVSRASLEALYLGIPCVLRDVDGNAELVREGINGSLFRQDADLAASMMTAANLRPITAARSSLLPKEFTQEYAERCFVRLIERLQS
ncbi:glycosyltransferase involved in cell wall biosynthesis [Pseudomonas alcaliphila]|nr:glycosyltransferase [Pseudomonas sp. 3400]MDR7012320.1 glycosyltransferase involved in cell wall biosynthesis [Pseudomonas alcaliphila]